MKNKHYIVESGNWKCSVLFNNKNFTTTEQKIIEVCTLAFESIYKQMNHKNVEIYSLLDENGNNYYGDIEITSIPNLYISLISKCYEVTNQKSKYYYYIVNDLLFANAALPHLIEDFTLLKSKAKDQSPKLYKLANSNKKIHKYTN